MLLPTAGRWIWQIEAFGPPAVGEQIELEGFDLGRVIAASLARDP